MTKSSRLQKITAFILAIVMMILLIPYDAKVKAEGTDEGDSQATSEPTEETTSEASTEGVTTEDAAVTPTDGEEEIFEIEENLVGAYYLVISESNRTTVNGVTYADFSKYADGVNNLDVTGATRKSMLKAMMDGLNNGTLGTAYGAGGWNCTAFVQTMLTRAGGTNLPPTTSTGDYGWEEFIRNQNIGYRTFMGDDYDAVVDQVCNYATPGDIIWIWDTSATRNAATESAWGDVQKYGITTSISASHHIGIYVGNYFDRLHGGEMTGNGTGGISSHISMSHTSTNRDLWWHSGEYNGEWKNQISPITPKAYNTHTAMTVIKWGSSDIKGDVTIKKVDPDNKPISGIGFRLDMEYTDWGGSGVIIDPHAEPQYVTDANGTFHTTGLYPGHYYIYECAYYDTATGTWDDTRTSDGKYKRSTDVYEVVVDVNGIYSASDKSEYNTGQDGTVHIDKNGNTFHINVSAKPVIPNTPNDGSIKVHKSSDNTAITNGNRCYSLEGAVFGVFKTEAEAKAATVRNENAVTTITTDKNGNGESEKIPVATYYVKETKAPKGYELNSTVYKAVIKSDTPVELNVTEKPGSDPANIVLKKKDAEQDEYLSGGKFVIKYYDVIMSSDPAKSGEKPKATWYFITDERGQIFLASKYLDKSKTSSAFYLTSSGNPTFPWGTITVQEYEAPEGFLVDNTVHVYKNDPDTDKLPLTSTQNARILPNNPVKAEVKVYKKSADEAVTKDNSCYSLQGAVFGIFKTEADAKAATENNEKAVTTITTDKNGNGTSEKIRYGTYYMKETKAPEGYEVVDKIYKIEVKTTNPVEFNIDEQPGGDPIKLVLVKKADEKDIVFDKDGTMTEEEVFIQGAKFTVKYFDTYSDSNPEDKGQTAKATWYFVTDAEGKIFFDEEHLDPDKKSSAFYKNKAGEPMIPWGTITVQETEAPVQFLVNDTVYTYVNDSKAGGYPLTETANERIITNRNKKQPFQIIKFGENGKTEMNTLSNAGFSACRVSDLKKDANGNYVWDDKKAIPLAQDGSTVMYTDEKGYARSMELKYGQYMVRETVVPENYLPIDDFFVTIEKDSREPQEMRYFTDDSFKAFLKVIKKDSDSGQSILNNSATFKIWSYDKQEYVSMKMYVNSRYKTVDEFSTNEDGVLITPEVLYPGKYRLDEISCPVGYYIENSNKALDIEVKSDAVYEAYVDDEGNVSKDMGIFTIEVDNAPVKGKIKVEKKGGNRYYDETKKEFVVTDEPLSDIIFDVVADEDIVAAYDKTKVIYKKDTIVTSIKTDKDGLAETDLIPLGVYRLEEHTPADYEESEPVKVSLTLDSTSYEENKEGVIRKYVFEKKDVYNKPKEQKIHTTAKDAASNTQFAKPDEQITIIDKVEYENLVVDGRSYTLKGVLMMQDIGLPLMVDGKPVTAEKTFIPKEADGYEELSFTFNASALAGSTIVVFEDLYDGEKKVAVHTDITSVPQTISFPKLGTKARDAVSGSNKAKVSKTTTLVDTIHYEGLMPGAEVKYMGILYDIATNKPILVNGKEVTAELIHKPETSEGDVEMTFVFDSTGLENKSVCVFEYAYSGDSLIAEHADIQSKEQTITFEKKPDTPKTGDSAKPIVVMAVMIITAGLATGLLLANRLKRRIKEDEE